MLLILQYFKCNSCKTSSFPHF